MTPRNGFIAAVLLIVTGLVVWKVGWLSPTFAAGSSPQELDEKSDWGLDPVWDDGRAEVATYEAARTVYQQPRRFETVLITVKEDFTKAFYVKADPPSDGKDLLTVLKLNIVSEIPTEQYPYRYLTSVFVDRAQPMRVVKMTTSSQEWCGNTFKEFIGWDGRPRLIFYSYFDHQGDGTYLVDLRAGDLLEDQIPVSFRSLSFKPGLEFVTHFIETQITNQVSMPRLLDAAITVTGLEPIETGIGTIPSWNVEVKAESLTQHYWFEQASPNILTRFTSSDGRQLVLKARTRRKYW